MANNGSIILFDDACYKNLWPLNFTKPIAKLRLGYFTIEELWGLISQLETTCLTGDYLSKKHTTNYKGNDNLYVNAAILPSIPLWHHIKNLQYDEALYENKRLVACRLKKPLQTIEDILSLSYQNIKYLEKITWLNQPKAFFKYAEQSILLDIALLNKNGFQQPSNQSCPILVKPANCFIHSTARVNCLSLNAEKGPIIIGENALIMEGAMLRGPLTIGKNAVVKMGAKIYGPTTIGPYCKVGGEVSNSIFQGYSNKGHDGYLGNSVIGEWCNFGADSNCSNLKNNYSLIKTWSYAKEDYTNSEEQFHGLIMGDHSKCGINTMFNTGTVTGLFVNLFSGNFPPKFIPSYTWGINETYRLEKALETAERVMQRRNLSLHQVDIDILQHIFKLTESYRKQIL